METTNMKQKNYKRHSIKYGNIAPTGITLWPQF